MLRSEPSRVALRCHTVRHRARATAAVERQKCCRSYERHSTHTHTLTVVFAAADNNMEDMLRLSRPELLEVELLLSKAEN